MPLDRDKIQLIRDLEARDRDRNESKQKPWYSDMVGLQQENKEQTLHPAIVDNQQLDNVAERFNMINERELANMSEEEVLDFKIKTLKRTRNLPGMSEDMRVEWDKKYKQALKQKVEHDSNAFSRLFDMARDMVSGE